MRMVAAAAAAAFTWKIHQNASRLAMVCTSVLIGAPEPRAILTTTTTTTLLISWSSNCQCWSSDRQTDMLRGNYQNEMIILSLENNQHKPTLMVTIIWPKITDYMFSLWLAETIFGLRKKSILQCPIFRLASILLPNEELRRKILT